MLEKYIENVKDEIISQTCRLIQIPSVYEESTNALKPFGENVNKALEYMLSLGEELGFRTKNIDGYCGYIEFGEGDELIGIIGHLDVVPVGEGWTYKPFSGIVQNGKIYGRGAIDDKGPVVASLYAMKAVMDTCKVNKRVRLIVGLNEETEWKCINYYKQHEEIPAVSFSPDADFPCIYAEKGFLSIYMEDDYSQYLDQALVIEKIDCKDNAINVVPKECSIQICINDEQLHADSILAFIENICGSYLCEFDFKKIDDKKIQITCYGLAAHAAHPELGKNAISSLLTLLYDVFKNFNVNVGILHMFYNYLGNDFYGEKLGLNFADESGKLTINVGNIALEDNKLKIGLNIRVPVNTKLSTVSDKLFEVASPYQKITTETVDSKNPLYVPKDNPLVRTLCNIFNKVSGLNESPIAIGGTTYAKAFDNCVSFGANMPGNKDMCHQADEFISIENLILASKIYAEAIFELAK